MNRSEGALSCAARPPKHMNGSAHGSSAHRYARLRLPPLAILLLAGLGVGFQQRLHAHLQRGFFSRWTPRNGAWQHVSGLTPLFEVALDRRPRDRKAFDDLGAGYACVNGAKNRLSHLLRIDPHASIVSPDAFFPQATGVNKVPLALHIDGMQAKGAIYLFESARKHKYTDRGVHKMRARYAAQAGITRSMSPHKWRHFFFTWLKKEGIDDSLIQPYSGHAMRQSLEIYSRLQIADAQPSYNQATERFPIQ